MDAERIQRLGSLVAIGVASQVSAEIMTSKSSAHSFWILVGVSLVMMVIKVVFEQLLALQAKIEPNWKSWVTILAQTMLGLETIVWTLYGSATGQWVLAMYNGETFMVLLFIYFSNFSRYFADMTEVPTFFYFLPLWAFLFGYYAVAAPVPPSKEEASTRVGKPVAVKIEGLVYS